jgi:hypothetical protein
MGYSYTDAPLLPRLTFSFTYCGLLLRPFLSPDDQNRTRSWRRTGAVDLHVLPLHHAVLLYLANAEIHQVFSGGPAETDFAFIEILVQI